MASIASGEHHTIRSLARPAVKPGTNVYYFAATARNETLESDYSNEAVFTNVLKSEFVLVSWDASPSTNVTGYRVYFGRRSGQYTNMTEAGTNLTCPVRILPPILSNVVVIVLASNATHLMFKESLSGHWYTMITNYWRTTNPTSPRFFRALGTNAGSKVFINAIRQ